MDPAHPSHDLLLIARSAGGDADPDETAAAQHQLASCADCRALHADLRAIQASTNASVLRVPPRPRSFRIPADELVPSTGPAWKRWLGRFGAPRFDFVPPLATVVAGLGLAVIVVGSASTASFSFLGGPASAPGAPTELTGRDQAAGQSPAATAAPSAAPVPVAGQTPAAGATPPTYDSKSAHPSASPSGAEGGASQSEAPGPPQPAVSPGATAGPSPVSTAAPGLGIPVEAPGPGGPAPLAVLGIVLLAGGAGALVLNLVARRFAAR